jgi:hypothetical protein
MTQEAEAQGKRIVIDLQHCDSRSFRAIQTDDAVYAAAKKHGLLSVMEQIFRLEAAGWIHNDGTITQELITSTFKGNRESERFTCACPDRMKEYISSSCTAWESLMDAILYVARSLTNFQRVWPRNECQIALVHRSARDIFVTINLALIHEKVAKAIFFGSNRSKNKRTTAEAKDYALQILAPKLQLLFRNNGEGFAPSSIDHNETVQANIFRHTAMLSYWFGKLVDSDRPRAFIETVNLTDIQETLYETLARPLAEGCIQLGREVTMEESRMFCLRANREYQQRTKEKKGEKKKGKKNRKRA